MLTRIISGTWYIALLAIAYFLKIIIPGGDFFVDVLIYVFSLIGTFEMLRALKDKTTKWERGIVYAFAVICIPVGVSMKIFLGWGITATGVCILGLSIALLSLLVFRHDETSLESIGLSFIAAVYPTIFLMMLIVANHAQALPSLPAFDSRILILFIFVTVPCVDSCAYLFGKFLRKFFPQKIAPVLSPNKTVVGCIGGIVGGLLSATALYFIYNALVGSFDKMYIWLPVYLTIGFITAIATEFGDLVESCVKRKLHIKDMGDIMPGHGGILDRLDSTLFATVAVYSVYALIGIIVGGL